jgi:hypothetical protein
LAASAAGNQAVEERCMDNVQGRQYGLFQRLNGAPAQALIVAGLVLLLAAPLIPAFRSASVARAQTELSQVDALTELDLDDLKRNQEREQKDDLEAAQRDNAAPINYALGAELVQKLQQEKQSREEARQAREKARQKVFDDKKDELEKKYDSNARKRALMDAQVTASGMRWHLLWVFLGNVMLLVGLMVITLESDGVRQKIALVILLVVMFSALSGISMNFLASGSVGDRSGAAGPLLK